jgi:hypothetical protein
MLVQQRKYRVIGILLAVHTALVHAALGSEQAATLHTVCEVLKSPGRFRGSALRIQAKIGEGHLHDDKCNSIGLRLETPMVAIDSTITAFESMYVPAYWHVTGALIDVSGTLVWKELDGKFEPVLIASHVWSFAGRQF